MPRAVCADRVPLAAENRDRLEDLTDYYTLWAHQIKTPIAAARLLLQEDPGAVSGEVEVELRPYHFAVLGCSSDYDLMSSRFGEYGESNKSFSGQDVVGFTRVTANPLKIYFTIHDND